jgi:hypothetical protein
LKSPDHHDSKAASHQHALHQHDCCASAQRRSRPQDRHWAPGRPIVRPRTRDFALKGPGILRFEKTRPEPHWILYAGRHCILILQDECWLGYRGKLANASPNPKPEINVSPKQRVVGLPGMRGGRFAVKQTEYIRCIVFDPPAAVLGAAAPQPEGSGGRGPPRIKRGVWGAVAAQGQQSRKVHADEKHLVRRLSSSDVHN